MNVKNKLLWKISNVCSLILAASIVSVWCLVEARYDPNIGQLTNKQQIDQYLQSKNIDPNKTIPTGIFIQSLMFTSSSNVNLTGYVWQRYKDDDRLIEEDDKCNIIFPEAVESGSNVDLRVAYEKQIGQTLIVGCYFEVTLRQRFNYSKYPLDHKTVWVRMWNRKFNSDRILVPDLSAYRATREEDAFGYDREIVLSGWKIKETFFNYRDFDYDTNFGMGYKIPERGKPELFFNIVIKRKFLNGFLIHVVPIIVVALLLYGALMMMTEDIGMAQKFGLNTSATISFCSGLFFILLLAQTQLRETFAGAGIVYIEYFHTLMYLAVLAVSINAYLFDCGGKSWLVRWIRYQNNILPKVLFWPVVLSMWAIVTCFVLLPEEKISQEQVFLQEAEANCLSFCSLKVTSASQKTSHNSQKHSDSEKAHDLLQA
ncbi:hypothetical protein [Mastigocoleus sp. MO_188.B34]|uniref:hypothetical protein n=1 Tax=Mastigocoleus sp. MO_188.B34 TaxID=3036635 RepID=UPI002604A889|nr:hypothetical protein [Mastigocoleus sp. MO_188.B34]MDJ0697675.1 hypothetical protein [Mastigocoleus sp. MO_188.B34]